MKLTFCLFQLVLELFETYGGTAMLGVPTMLIALIEHPDFVSRDVEARAGLKSHVDRLSRLTPTLKRVFLRSHSEDAMALDDDDGPRYTHSDWESEASKSEVSEELSEKVTESSKTFVFVLPDHFYE